MTIEQLLTLWKLMDQLFLFNQLIGTFHSVKLEELFDEQNSYFWKWKKWTKNKQYPTIEKA